MAVIDARPSARPAAALTTDTIPNDREHGDEPRPRRTARDQRPSIPGQPSLA